MESMLACRVGELDLLLPFEGMERLIPWFDVKQNGDQILWNDEEIPCIRLGDCLGFPKQVPALDAGIAVLRIHDETMAVLADRFLGLVDIDLTSSFRIPLNWILNHPGLPYRAFHMVQNRVTPEVAPFHLLVKNPATELWPPPLQGIRDPQGNYLAVSINDVSAAIPVDSVEHVVDGDTLITLPGLPATLLGMLEVRSHPVPVARPLPEMTSARVIVILKCSMGLVGLAVDATYGMVALSHEVDDQDQECPPLLGGCDVLNLDPLGNVTFTIDPERIWVSVAG
jgi:chemotaxis signal transduction protein